MMQTKEVNIFTLNCKDQDGVLLMDAMHAPFQYCKNTWIGAASLKLKAQYCCRVFHSNLFCLYRSNNLFHYH